MARCAYQSWCHGRRSICLTRVERLTIANQRDAARIFPCEERHFVLSEGRQFETAATIKIDSFTGPMGSVDRCCHVADPPLEYDRLSLAHCAS